MLTKIYVYCTKWLTDYMEHSHCHEADSSLASQEILCILWDSKLHYGDHKSPSTVSVLSHTFSVHALRSSFFNKHFNITAPSTHSLTIRRMLIFTMGTLNYLEAGRLLLGSSQWRLTATFLVWRPSTRSETWGRAVSWWQGSIEHGNRVDRT